MVNHFFKPSLADSPHSPARHADGTARHRPPSSLNAHRVCFNYANHQKSSLSLFSLHANIDFVDAYNAFHMKEQGLTEILTYDRKHFARIPWVHIGEL